MWIKERIKLCILRFLWRRKNSDNYTVANTSFDINNVYVGKNTYGDLNIKHYNKEASLNIGCYCSIADEVVFLLGGVHNYKRISSWPFYSRIYRNAVISNENPQNYSIEIGNDVWIGYGAIILPGVKIGDGSIIGARSVVAKDIEPYSVYVGNKTIKKRFSDEIVNKLKSIKWENVNHTVNDEYSKWVTTEINEDNIDEILKDFTM